MTASALTIRQAASNDLVTRLTNVAIGAARKRPGSPTTVKCCSNTPSTTPAIARAVLVQLAFNKAQTDVIQFYKQFSFTAIYEGLKLLVTR